MKAAFLVSSLACGLALVAMIDFFFGDGRVGVILLPGAMALNWWASQRAREHRQQ